MAHRGLLLYVFLYHAPIWPDCQGKSAGAVIPIFLDNPAHSVYTNTYEPNNRPFETKLPRHGNRQFNSIQFNSIQFNSIQFNSSYSVNNRVNYLTVYISHCKLKQGIHLTKARAVLRTAHEGTEYTGILCLKP